VVFNYVYVLTKGGPGSATTVMELEITSGRRRRDQPNIAAPWRTMLLILVAFFIVGQSLLRKRLLRGSA
jgi:ABC-type sugar transport system permease subunit